MGDRAGDRAATGLLGIRIPDEVRQQLRYGRGLDNRKLKQSGYRFGLTTRETVQAFAEALRLQPLRESGEAPYRYEREVEEFLRWSPSVRRDESSAADAPAVLQAYPHRRSASYHQRTRCVLA